MISGSAKLDEMGKISIAGPITNIIFSIAFLGVALVPSNFQVLFFLAALLNGFIALFNLIPMGILDGYKIFSWNKTVWGLAFAASAVLTAIPYLYIYGYI